MNNPEPFTSRASVYPTALKILDLKPTLISLPFCILHMTTGTRHPEPKAHTPNFPHSTLYTLHPIPCTPHPAPCIQHSPPQTLTPFYPEPDNRRKNFLYSTAIIFHSTIRWGRRLWECLFLSTMSCLEPKKHTLGE
jgi:hypothetical protein